MRAQRDLIGSFLTAMPPTLQNMYASKPLMIVSPVTQFGGGGFPGGRSGYHQWLAQFNVGGNVIPGLFRAAGGQPGDTIGRVCVMGFSNGCIGVDEVLRAKDSAKIDTVLAIDGIHGGYISGRQLYLPAYKRYLNHAAHVVQQNPEADVNAPIMVATHSAIVPPNFPSTTETTDLIWRMAWTKAPEDVLTLDCDFDCVPVIYERALASVTWPGGKKLCSNVTNKCYSWKGLADGWLDRRIANNLFVLGWGDRKGNKIVTRDPMGTVDHIFQGRVVLRELLKEFTVKRWNAQCGVVAATAGFGQDDVVVQCTRPGRGVVYDQSDAGAKDYFPDIPESAPPPTKCPAPPPGHVIVGGDNPCETMKLPPPPPKLPPTAAAPPVDWQRALWVGLGAAAGYGGVRMASKLLRRR